MKVLIADNDRGLIKRFEDEIKKMAGTYDLKCVYTGSDALNELLTGDYERALLDRNMPNMTGVQVAEKLKPYRDSDPKYKKLIIALHTSDESYASPYAKKPLLEKGIDFVFIKGDYDWEDIEKFLS